MAGAPFYAHGEKAARAGRRTRRAQNARGGAHALLLFSVVPFISVGLGMASSMPVFVACVDLPPTFLLPLGQVLPKTSLSLLCALLLLPSLLPFETGMTCVCLCHWHFETGQDGQWDMAWDSGRTGGRAAPRGSWLPLQHFGFAPEACLAGAGYSGCACRGGQTRPTSCLHPFPAPLLPLFSTSHLFLFFYISPRSPSLSPLSHCLLDTSLLLYIYVP